MRAREIPPLIISHRKSSTNYIVRIIFNYFQNILVRFMVKYQISIIYSLEYFVQQQFLSVKINISWTYFITWPIQSFGNQMKRKYGKRKEIFMEWHVNRFGILHLNVSMNLYYFFFSHNHCLLYVHKRCTV